MKVLKWILGILAAIGGVASAIFISKRINVSSGPDGDERGELATGIDNDLIGIRQELRRNRDGLDQSRDGVSDIRSGIKRGRAATRRLRKLMARVPDSE